MFLYNYSWDLGTMGFDNAPYIKLFCAFLLACVRILNPRCRKRYRIDRRDRLSPFIHPHHRYTNWGRSSTDNGSGAHSIFESLRAYTQIRKRKDSLRTLFRPLYVRLREIDFMASSIAERLSSAVNY